MKKGLFKNFKQTIYQFYKRNGRRLPWRETINPYHILISEVMLQQTQVDRVIPKYKTFVQRFPSFITLARAPLSEILKVWQGLGYNRRALYLKQLATIVTRQYNSQLPQTLEELIKLPGIGKATAAAILTYVFNQSVAFIETNIRSVFIHFFFNDYEDVHDKDVLPLIEKTLDRKNPRDWYWALMDYGSMLKKKYGNASRQSAHYTKQSALNGSNRQIRGLILKALLNQPIKNPQALAETINRPTEKVIFNLIQLQKEGFIFEKNGRFALAK